MKPYQDLVVADFAGMTADQIHDVLDHYEAEAEKVRRLQKKIEQSARDYINRNF